MTPRPRRPDRTTIDPELLTRGEVGELTAHHDRYFVPDHPGALESMFARAVGRLPEPDRSCVVMCAMQGLTYDDAADLLAPELGRTVHRKTVWRWTRRGLAVLRGEFEGTSWMAVLLAGRLPASGDVPPEDPNNESDKDRQALEGDDATDTD